MKRRYLKKVVIISSILAVTAAGIIIWTQTLSYKRGRLRAIVKGFRSGEVASRVTVSPSIGLGKALKATKELKYLVSLVYSDMSLFKELVNTIKEERANGKEDEWLVHDNWRNTLFSDFTRFPVIGDILGENAFHERHELNELIGMLEELASTDDSELKGYIAGAIASHTDVIFCARSAVGELKQEHLKSGFMKYVPATARRVALQWGRLEDRPLSAETVTRLLDILEKDAKKYDRCPQYRYYDILFQCIAGYYYEYEAVRKFLHDIMINPSCHVLGVHGATMTGYWQTKDSKLVDFVVDILLDKKFHPEIRRATTWAFGSIGNQWAKNKIDTPKKKKKYFDALCKAAQTDPEESVRQAAIRRIELFDDPEAKAFLEKVKAGAQK